jgi:hypothetical protein
MGLDEDAAVEDPHQLPVGAHLDPTSDQVAGDRIQRLGHLDVMITMDLRRRVDGQVIGHHRRREQPRCFLEREMLGRAQRRGPVHTQTGGRGAPRLGAAAGIREVDEVLAGEERTAHIGHDPLHLRLVGGVADPAGVDGEAPGLGVLGEGLVDARFERVSLVDDPSHVVGDYRAEHPAEEQPRRLEPLDHRVDRLRERQAHEAVAGATRGEDQGVAHPAPFGDGIEQQPHPAEVDLQLVAGLTVGDPHRRGPSAAGTAQLRAITLHGPRRDHHPTAAQQRVHLGHREPVDLQPRADLLGVAVELPPRHPVPVSAVRPHRLDHHRHEHVT